MFQGIQTSPWRGKAFFPRPPAKSNLVGILLLNVIEICDSCRNRVITFNYLCIIFVVVGLVEEVFAMINISCCSYGV